MLLGFDTAVPFMVADTLKVVVGLFVGVGIVIWSFQTNSAMTYDPKEAQRQSAKIAINFCLLLKFNFNLFTF